MESSLLNDNKMHILGHFSYHIYEVKLEASYDETKYCVTCIEKSLHETEIISTELYEFDDLRPARDAFENAINNCIYRTSFTDISLYMQRGL